MGKRFVIILAALSISCAAQARTYHVAVNGNDTNPGTQTAPLHTIQRAAYLALPGDLVTVHAGIYRERVNPRHGGASDEKRIVYQAAPGEKVVITGSEEVKNWVKVQGDVWKTTLQNSFFHGFNPYSDLIHGDWFNPLGRQHHTGAVYLNGAWLPEAASLDDVMKGDGLWFGQVDEEKTTIWADFKGVDPNQQRVEINVRRTVFYPEKTGIDYITVRGFILEDAATPWAPPTAEQIGVIGPHWSKGWVIENNVVRNSICAGISLGKYGDEWDNTSANSAEGYVETIHRALAIGWAKENIGHHVVRNNEIYNCGQAGIVGSLGAAFSTVSNNVIHEIHMRRDFSGAEMAGIKFHGAIDVEIAHNHIYRTCLGLWLDWMAQGTMVEQNLFHDNDADIFVEVDHGPFVVANNLLLSRLSLRDNSQGGAYAHNLLAGTIERSKHDRRLTPILQPHSTAVASLHDNPPGDDRFYNNLFVERTDLSVYDHAQLPLTMDGNVYLGGAKPSQFEAHPVVEPDANPELKLETKPDGLYLQMKLVPNWDETHRHTSVTSALLGRATIPNLPYERPDGSQIQIDRDFFGKERNKLNPAAGPFEQPRTGELSMKVW